MKGTRILRPSEYLILRNQLNEDQQLILDSLLHSGCLLLLHAILPALFLEYVNMLPPNVVITAAAIVIIALEVWLDMKYLF